MTQMRDDLVASPVPLITLGFGNSLWMKTHNYSDQ